MQMAGFSRVIPAGCPSNSRVCMATPPPSTRAAVQKALSDLSALAQFAGPPKEFWPRFLEILLELTRADQLVLLAQRPGSPWRRLLDRPLDMAPCLMLTTFANRLPEIADSASHDATALVRLELKQGSTAGHFAVAARLNLPQSQEQCIIAALLSEVSETVADEVLLRIRLAGQTPQAYLAQTAAAQARVDVEKFASTVDLFASLAGEKRFMAVAMSVCNGLASKFKCDRVSLGWLKGGFVHLQAISRIEKFDRQMTAAKSLESAMEEALDQDDEIIWPVPDGSTTVSRDHERFAREQESGNLCSLPLRNGDDPLAVITCERQSPGFSQAEVQQLRLIADLVAPRLAELHSTDRWFGSRWASSFRERAGKLIGPEHTWAKLLALLITIVLALLIFLQVPYRVEGNFILRSDQSSYLSAPYEGYIEHVFVRPGDAVTNNQPLLQLKTAELQLDEAYALADLNHYLRDAEKARASRLLADMRISEALADQARAHLELIRYRIGTATIRADMAGVVIEGDLRDRLGSPVKAGDILFRVGGIDPLYAETDVNERDIHEVLGRTSGQIAFVGRPRSKFPIHILAVEPAAIPKTGANDFLVRCALDGPHQDWWRPGMSGICKIDAGKRSLLWVLTHRTIDFLRLKLWW